MISARSSISPRSIEQSHFDNLKWIGIPGPAIVHHGNRFFSAWIFRNLLLVTRQQLLPAKAFAPNLELSRVGEVIFLGNLLLTKSLPHQQLMTEAPNDFSIPPA
jgi:hypothetical protein